MFPVMTVLEILLLIILIIIWIAIAIIALPLLRSVRHTLLTRPATGGKSFALKTASREEPLRTAVSAQTQASAARNQGDHTTHKAGSNRGENVAVGHLKAILNRNDVWLQDVELTVHSRPVRFENIIVNPNGIFILEIKSYLGILSGEAEDYEWTQTRITEAGSSFEKQVKNPIPLVQRQIILLEDYLKANGFHLWVNGYAYLVQKNGPVVHPVLLRSFEEMEHELHSEQTQRLSQSDINAIVYLLQPQAGIE